ncbi:ribosome biogenesis protein BRX1 homolog [Watersipora subatra]|uniref:ribosome biogenesis protein BRX1 homolog n=1 Tax=Watersipora subatra TaxID=2589382 RepID=UPI00355B6ADB
MAKKMSSTKKRKSSVISDNTKESQPSLPSTVFSDQLEPVAKKGRWSNKERVLVFSSRGIGHRERHLMTDLRALMPHSKPDSKMEKSEKLLEINEIAEMKNCNKVLFFDSKKRKDLYLWAANTPSGPSVKFLVENIHTMDELKLTGNCLRGSRPILSFEKAFDSVPHYQLLKELFTQIFGTPNNHPKSQPFVDNVYTFSICDNRIWFRNFQIVEESGSLVEIGPRFVLNPVKIFAGSFGGATLWQNPHYTSPNLYRRVMRQKLAQKYHIKNYNKDKNETRKANLGPSYKKDITHDVFTTIDGVKLSKSSL